MCLRPSIGGVQWRVCWTWTLFISLDCSMQQLIHHCYNYHEFYSIFLDSNNWFIHRWIFPLLEENLRDSFSSTGWPPLCYVWKMISHVYGPSECIKLFFFFFIYWFEKKKQMSNYICLLLDLSNWSIKIDRWTGQNAIRFKNAIGHFQYFYFIKERIWVVFV